MARRRRGKAIHGWVLLDKPSGMTSTHAVSRVKRAFDANKAGHAGTLDPIASGMLPIALGEATKTVPFIVDSTKVYHFTVCWGAETSTDDAEGHVTGQSQHRPDACAIKALLSRFTGEISQTPPAYSAIKIAGERAYDLARAGEEPELRPRTVVVHQFDYLGSEDADHALFEVSCGKGTYVRALARDMGRALGCYGHVCALRRVAVGPFREEDMISLELIEELSHSAAGQGDLAKLLRPAETALDDIPALAISRPDAARLRQGLAILLRGRDAPLVEGTVYAMSGNTLVAVGDVRQGELHPVRVFNIAGQM